LADTWPTPVGVEVNFQFALASTSFKLTAGIAALVRSHSVPASAVLCPDIPLPFFPAQYARFVRGTGIARFR
jgi:hypothetical protein